MYSRIRNENGSLSSRCLYCFATIASAAETTSDLQSAEAGHICPEKAWAQLLALQRTALTQMPGK
jgi:hypothetical protein